MSRSDISSGDRRIYLSLPVVSGVSLLSNVSDANVSDVPECIKCKQIAHCLNDFCRKVGVMALPIDQKDSVGHRFLQKTVRHPNEYFCFWIFNKFPVILVPANWEKIIPAIMLSCEFWLSSPANSNVSIVTLKSPAFISFVLLTHQQTDPAVISYNRLKRIAQPTSQYPTTFFILSLHFPFSLL